MDKSILENIIEEVPNMEEFSPVSDISTEEDFSFAYSFFNDSWFSIGRRAVELLEDPVEIKEFMKQYINYVQKESGVSENDKAEERVKEIIGYSTGYVDERKARIWFKTLPDIRHPIVGRERFFMHGKNVQSYYLICKDSDQEFKEYMQKALNQDFRKEGLIAACEVRYIPNKDNCSYFAFQITPKTEGIFQKPSEIYTYLTGYIKGLSARIKEETGKSCELVLDILNKK